MARRKAKQSVHHVEITAGSNHPATAAVAGVRH